MKILLYSSKLFEKEYLVRAARNNQEIVLITEPLSLQTVSKARGFEIISIFTTDDASAPVIKALAEVGVKLIAVRAAGYDHVDLDIANECGITVSNVPEYSPYAVAELTVALLLALNRKLVLARQQVQAQNFSLENLIGFDLKDKTVGIVGTGRIGAAFARIMHGFGCYLLAHDVTESKALQYKFDVHYTSLEELCQKSDVISLHTPLTLQTKHLINAKLLHQMKPGIVLLNTARGAIVKTEDIIKYLENGHIGAYGMDVYEGEKGIFFYNHIGEALNDKQLEKLMQLPNVLITPHQGFATKEALANIAETTFANIDAWANYCLSGNELTNPSILTNESNAAE
ncbi:MAG: 2-hydroxyacid dehydrogenase [Chitinophagaceae bacterium]|nr:MAG: 2-hydroxyacid dehydrogenase [Chitinophagaceae bacterium]